MSSFPSAESRVASEVADYVAASLSSIRACLSSRATTFPRPLIWDCMVYSRPYRSNPLYLEDDHRMSQGARLRLKPVYNALTETEQDEVGGLTGLSHFVLWHQVRNDFDRI